MSFEAIFAALQSFFDAQPYLAGGLVLLLALLAAMKPKFMLKSATLAICLVLAVMAVTSLNGTLDSGVAHRDAMLESADR